MEVFIVYHHNCDKTDLNTCTDEFVTLLNILQTSKNLGICVEITTSFFQKSIETIQPIILLKFNCIINGFVSRITFYTRTCDTTRTLVENVYTKVIDKPHISGLLLSTISGHQKYFCVLNDNTVKNNDKTKYITTENF